MQGESRQRSAFPASLRFGMLWAWTTLILALSLTAWTWRLASEDAEMDASERFDFQVAEIRFAVLTRMHAQEQVLRGAVGLLKASEYVSRDEWRNYVQALKLEEFYPGIQGLGFARYIPPAQLPAHIRAVRAEGFPDYTVWPPGKRSEYTSIVYLEPFDWRNRRAFGYDMFAEPTRHAAMATARDTGRAAISGKVTLVQETESEVQAGFLIYLPVYRKGAAIDSVAQRRAALQGYVYSPLRMADLMRGILGERPNTVRLEIFDGSEIIPASLMYDSHPSLPPLSASASAAGSGAKMVSHTAIVFDGRTWTLRISARPEFLAHIPRQKAQLVLQAGILISLLLFAIVWSQATLGRRAAALATSMTAALRESREQFRAVSETANDAIISADIAGCITYFNRAAERIFGYTQANALGQPLTLLMPERYRKAHERGFKRFLDTGEAHIIGKTIELLASRQDGSEFPIEISVSNWTTAQGTFFTAILRDISDRLKVEEQIHRLNIELHHQVDQLAAVNRELESFTYTVSHDLRAPLRAVDGFGRIFEDRYGGNVDDEGRRLIKVIRDNSRKMGRLIDDLLTFSRLGRTPIAREPVDMFGLAQAVVAEIRQLGDAGDAVITIADMPPARGDRALLHQVWMNLLANAVKFSSTRRPPRIEAGGQRADGEIHYYVRDNGVGFDMAYAGQLFGVFQRLHRPDEFPGTGVGLAIVQRIVLRHGGRVWSEGKVDQGATFYFSLPADEPG